MENMRDIKFRAWDARYTYMTYKVLVGNTCDKDDRYTAHALIRDVSKLDYKCDESVWMHFDEHSEIVLMQYTGLKDKNGVEIYEGDILEDYDNQYIGVVSFEKGAFIVTWEGECCDAFEWSGEEVVGNIYEHPHLLEHL